MVQCSGRGTTRYKSSLGILLIADNFHNCAALSAEVGFLGFINGRRVTWYSVFAMEQQNAIKIA